MESVLVTGSKPGEGKWFESLWGEEDLTDVTLVCRDGSQLVAHKTVLALSSPLLKTILTSSKSSNPILLLLSTDALVLERLLRLIYFGEVRLPADVYLHSSTGFLCVLIVFLYFCIWQGENAF